jgi:sugar/nucleoside kinase (ribokinase family)
MPVVRIPLPPARNKAAPDLLVAVNPVWEESWQVARLPEGSFDPATATGHVADGGGSALNTGCALAMAGWRVVAAGSVGEDREGEACVRALLCRGVVPQIHPRAGRRTAAVQLFVQEGTTERAFEARIPPGATPPWTDEPPGLAEARMLLVDRLGGASLSWLRSRRREGAGPSFLVLNAPPGSPRSSAWLEAALPLLDGLQLPENPDPTRGPARAPATEPARPPMLRSGLHRPPAAAPLTAERIAAIQAGGVRWLVRTRGREGAVLHVRDGGVLALPSRATTVVDPTGAGDALAAGMLDAVLRGAGPEEALERGLDWAARACRHLGARGWLDHEPPGSP